jgi:hypothetical protein
MSFRDALNQHAGRLGLREIAGLAGASKSEAREALADPAVRREYEAARARYIDALVQQLERAARAGNLRAVRELIRFARGIERRAYRRERKRGRQDVPASLREWPRAVVLPGRRPR